MIPPIIAAVLIAFQFTYPVSGPGRNGHVSSCSLPTGITSLWSAHNLGVTCYPGGISCTSGANIFQVDDAGGSGNHVDPVAQATSPTFTPTAIGTNAAFTYTSSSQDALLLSTQITPVGITIMMYSVLKPPASGSSPIFTSSNPLSSAQLNSIAWYLDSTEHPTLDASFSANIYNDASHSYASTWSELYFTNNFTTGAYTFGHCGAVSGCVQDGSGTSVQPWSNPSNSIGSYPAASLWFNGPIAEVGYNLTGSTTGLATYLACQYPTIP